MAILTPNREKLQPVFRTANPVVVSPDPSSLRGYNAALSQDQQTQTDTLSQVYRGTAVVRLAPLPASANAAANAASNSAAQSIVNSIPPTSSTFTSLTNGTNTQASMVVGSGASVSVSGTGEIEATELATTGAPVVVDISAPTHVGQLLISNVGNTSATWQDMPAVAEILVNSVLVTTPPSIVLVNGA
jgi:hypothetical protein